MGGTYEPALVQGIELNALPIFKDFGAPDQRYVVIVNDIKTFFQNLLNAGGFEKWNTSLLGGQWREETKPALETVYGHIGVILIGTHWLP
jgi:hypothetical protein